ncbi:MAG: recombination mediator RecR [Aquificaceae bacterium]|nr:recombination mediator RecR [Aquificaceae bacterium]MCS7196823.1 recombination mediator RecR [Aquificaceae bacterium]MCX7989841.1 recombination mediator RecR [Aquificaceae bacterium]MDW8033273.1 recombination mediator RecR [Aquificaceae bacterium]MDW8295188.1 recombination mediator RecR [Aquificaceae bacterium]
MSYQGALPEAIKTALEKLALLPTYGERSSGRFLYNLLKLPPESRLEVVKVLEQVAQNIKNCIECGIYTDREVCVICSEPKRSKKFICVVEEPQDAFAIEKLERYTGVYHVLGGRIAPLEGISPRDLRIDSLLDRVERYGAKEVILATNPNAEGEATATYIAKLLRRRFSTIKITRISYGLQFGSMVELADELSLEKSIENRKSL